MRTAGAGTPGTPGTRNREGSVLSGVLTVPGLSALCPWGLRDPLNPSSPGNRWGMNSWGRGLEGKGWGQGFRLPVVSPSTFAEDLLCAGPRPGCWNTVAKADKGHPRGESGISWWSVWWG